MTTFQAAKEINAQGLGLPWPECLRIAARLRRAFELRIARVRAQYFRQRRQALRGERFRSALHKAGKVLEGAQAREGRAGFPVEFCEPLRLSEYHDIVEKPTGHGFMIHAF
jgi:hypothetical protein